MSKQLRNRIAYWFFLLLGMSALINQYFIEGWQLVWYVEVIKSSLFGIFMFKPLVLIEIKDIIGSYFISRNNSKESDILETSNKRGEPSTGGTNPSNDEEV